MTSHTQIKAAAEAIAARLEIDAAELARLCREAELAGWTGKLDQLGAVFIAAGARRGARGRPAADAIVAAMFRDGPRRQEEKVRRVWAAVAGAGWDWQGQWRGRQRARDARGRMLPGGHGPAGVVA